jgi:hypothetical protein
MKIIKKMGILPGHGDLEKGLPQKWGYLKMWHF